MLTDARTLVPGTTLEGDVCIVGAGPAGITLARQLAADGLRVLLLESGGRRRGEAAADLTDGAGSGEPYYRLSDTRVRAFGGTSNHWGDNGPFRARPLEELDLACRDEIPDRPGWPFDRATLEPFYVRAHAWCGLGVYDYGVGRWASDERPEAPFATGSLTTHVFKLARPDVWTDRFDEVVADPGIHLVLHATVADISTDRDPQRVGGLTVRVPGGTTLAARADRYVLAAGGIENPRLLLLADRVHPGGIGNDHDLVGRFFMEHPQVRAGRIQLERLDAIEQLGLYQRHSSPEGTTGVWIHAKLGPTAAALREHAILGSTFFLNPVSRARSANATRSFVTLGHALTWRPRSRDLGGHLANVVLRDPVSVARTALDVARGRRHGEPEVLQLMSMGEQLPNPDSRVRLGTARDSMGMRVADVAWRLSPLDRRSIRRAHQLMDEELRASGCGWLEDVLDDATPPPEFKGGWHHMGTTRMHADPADGVVDGDGRVHGIDNLYVAGSSVFPTSGFANPTLTIVALALRMAEHLRRLAA